MASADAPLEVLSFEIEDIEPERLPDVIIALGGAEYTARCPNEFELIEIFRQLVNVETDPRALNLPSMVSSFFTDADAHSIIHRSRGAKPEITFSELRSALVALAGKYVEGSGERLAEASKKVKHPKVPQDHQRATRKR